MMPRYYQAFDPRPQGVGIARAGLTDALARWGVPQLREMAGLLVSEAVTNAIAHARTRLIVDVAWDGGTLRVEVTDSSPQLPELDADREFGAGGLGLQLIDALSDAWGSLMTANASGSNSSTRDREVPTAAWLPGAPG